MSDTNYSPDKKATLDPNKYREDWSRATEYKRAFYLDRPPMFSSAAAAQDAANRSRMLWCWAPIWIPWEYTNWMEEGRSFHDSAYIGDWSGLVKVRFRGPDAQKFLSYIGTNDLSKFRVGQAKHHVQTNEAGNIAAQGLLYRVGEEEFIFSGGSAYWAAYQLQQGTWNAHATTVSSESTLFSVQGPKSRDIVETATNSKLDLRFNDSAIFQIAGVDVRVVRTGITGELGYELHGPTQFGDLIWSTVVEAGEKFGIKQLGARAQIISHVEAGIATNDRDFVSAAIGTPGAPQIPPTARSKLIGSYLLPDVSDFFRTPAELGWYRQVSLETHDFIGREALLAERNAGGPERQLVGLIWNSKDVVEVYASLFDDEPVLAQMEMPRYMGWAIDKVTANGELIGCSTSRVYSPFLRQMISLGFVPREHARPGSTVTVIWGDQNGPQREIQAKVIALPFKPDVRRS